MSLRVWYTNSSFFYCTYFIMHSILEFAQNDEAKRIDCLKPHRDKENDKPDLKPTSCNPWSSKCDILNKECHSPQASIFMWRLPVPRKRAIRLGYSVINFRQLLLGACPFGTTCMAHQLEILVCIPLLKISKGLYFGKRLVTKETNGCKQKFLLRVA